MEIPTSKKGRGNKPPAQTVKGTGKLKPKYGILKGKGSDHKE